MKREEGLSNGMRMLSYEEECRLLYAEFFYTTYRLKSNSSRTVEL